jgi:hypothetical protein
MVAARLATMRQGERTDLPSKEGKSVSQKDAGVMLNVSTVSVERAKTVISKAEPELQRAVDRGTIKVSVAASLAPGGTGAGTL